MICPVQVQVQYKILVVIVLLVLEAVLVLHQYYFTVTHYVLRLTVISICNMSKVRTACQSVSMFSNIKTSMFSNIKTSMSQSKSSCVTSKGDSEATSCLLALM